MIFILAIRDLAEVRAEEIYEQSLEMEKWFLKNNSHSLKNKLKENDKIIVYKSGVTGGYFLGEFIVAKNPEEKKGEFNKIFEAFGYIVEIKNVETYLKKIYLKDHVLNLKFIKNKTNYGSALQRGNALISIEDYNYLKKFLKKGEANV